MGVPPPIQFASLGMADSLILMVLALVVFGPRRLPQIGRQIGKLMYEFRKASNDFKFQMEEELRMSEEADRRKKEEEERQRQLAANPPAQLEAGTTPATETSATEAASYNTYGEAAEAHERGDVNFPSIQPPSTGEPVQAAWSANESAETIAATHEPDAAPETAAKEVTPAKENAVIESAVEDLNKTTEPAAHNG